MKKKDLKGGKYYTFSYPNGQAGTYVGRVKEDFSDRLDIWSSDTNRYTVNKGSSMGIENAEMIIHESTHSEIQWLLDSEKKGTMLPFPKSCDDYSIY